jgi:hypothetical protein
MRRAVTTALFAALAALATLAAPTPLAAQAPASPRLWSTSTAFTLPEHRLEVGLFRPVRFGITADAELALHPVLELALPHLEGKVRWLHHPRVSISTWHRLSYPTLFLETVAREGTLGLLPANTRVPTTLGLDTSFLVTISAPDDRTHYTLELGLSVAPRLSGGDDVVLDFPFLYSRFGAVSTAGTTFAGLAVHGALSEHLAWHADLRLTSVPVVPHGFVLEQSASIAWHPTTTFCLSVGYRAAHGRYPVGVRTHVLPTIDVVLGF